MTNRALSIISNVLTLLEQDTSEAGKDFNTYLKDSQDKNTGHYDADSDEHAQRMTGDTGKFTSGERKSISTWTSPSGYKQINGHLRGQNPSSSAQKHVENLDSAMQKSPLTEETHLYRGIHGPHSDRFAKIKPGDTLYNHGYTATTIDPRRATHYARDGGDIFHITAPAGHPALYVSHPDLNSHTSEKEILLPHNTHMRYTHSETRTVPDYDYSGSPTGRTKTVNFHHVTVLPQAHDLSSALDKD